jgi:zinc protease
MRSVGALAAALALVGVVATAQVKPGSAVVIKGRAPVSTEVLKVKLPRPAETTLPNGLHLMVLQDQRMPQVSFQIWVPGAGGYYDPADLPGLAVMTAAMMREGTTSRTTLEIAELLETKASAVTVSTTFGAVNAVVSGSSLTEHFAETFALAADVLLQPTFPQEELDRYKTRSRAPLVAQRSNPGFLANELFNRVVYASHPAARVSLTDQGLDAATRERIVAFHRERFVPDHAVLGIAGDISMAAARSLAERHLGAWKKRGMAAPETTDPPAIGPARVHFIARPNSVQTSLWVGTQAIARTSADYDVVQVMNAVVGGGPTGRLFTHLREEKGYTYGAYSNVLTSPYRGAWLATTDVRSEVTAPALRDLLAEVTRMRDEVVPAKEFDDRRRGMVASFALSLESPAAVLSNHLTRWAYKLPVDYWDTYPARVMAVTPAQVQAAAKKYLDPSRLHIVAVGDPSKVEVFKAYGQVTVYDTNGRPIG